MLALVRVVDGLLSAFSETAIGLFSVLANTLDSERLVSVLNNTLMAFLSVHDVTPLNLLVQCEIRRELSKAL